MFKPFPHFGTNAIHCGQNPDQWKSGAVVPPISLATTFKQPHPGQPLMYDYSRAGNPTRSALETCISGVCDAKYAFTYSSGLACMDALIKMLHSGDHMICIDDVYGGSNRYLQQIASHVELQVSFVDLTSSGALEANMKEHTKMVWIETPTNPLLKIADIEKLTSLAHQKNDQCVVVVDNTFASPYFQRPLTMGADVEFHSMTKYMNGHTDVVMGCAATSNERIANHLKFVQLAVGSVPSPFDCFLVNRGLKTLHLRMKAHMDVGLKVAKWLEKSSCVDTVCYPLLPSHPQHELAKKQMRGFSGMISFYMKGNLEQAKTFLSALKVFTLAESLGGYESLAEHPAIMTHASVPSDTRKLLGIGDNLIRLSCGLEDPEDLIEDLGQALCVALGQS